MRIEEKSTVSIHGHDIKTYSISNGTIQLDLCTLGCTITAIIVPGAMDIRRNIVLGYNSPALYMEDDYYTGCTVGRVAGRISNASFVIDGNRFTLSQNEKRTTNHLHGGYLGFNKKNFRAVSETKNDKSASLLFYYKSGHLEEGYPGNMDVWIRYTLTDENKIIIDYRAITDKSTHVNLTNHSYFNFSGKNEEAYDHELCINADAYIPTDDHYIPTGDIIPVRDTQYDFRKRRKIFEYNLAPIYSYNECFVLNKKDSAAMASAVLYHMESGISMSVNTTLPGILLYTGDFLSSPFQKNQGICLEAMYFPDTPNRQEFPSTLLHPGEEYTQSIAFTFSRLK